MAIAYVIIVLKQFFKIATVIIQYNSDQYFVIFRKICNLLTMLLDVQ